MNSDLEFLTEALPQMQDYLLSPELFWPLKPSLPRLTLGSVLLALSRLDVVDSFRAQQLREDVERVRAQRRSAWDKKIVRETENRLRLWWQFLEEQENAGAASRAEYAAAVRNRVILQLIVADFLPQLATLDELLRRKFIPGAFVWDEIYRPAFAPADFWFLYGFM